MMRALLLAPLLLAGCTVGPDYRPPVLATPPAFTGPQPATSTMDVASWWQVFRDPTLDDLVARALRDSPDIATAASRVRQARLAEIVAGAANKPTLDSAASVMHIEFSKNAGLSSLAKSFGGGAAGGAAGGTAGGGGCGRRCGWERAAGRRHRLARQRHHDLLDRA